MKKFPEFGNNNNVRPPAVAGAFYPAGSRDLRSLLRNYFKNTSFKLPPKAKIHALIVPHAGYVYSGQTAAWAFAQLPKNLVNPRFILVGPPHQSPLFGLAGSSHDFWQTPLGLVPQKPTGGINDAAHENEHCLEVQLPFLQFLYKKFSVSCLLTGAEDSSFWPRPESFIIISSDLSHYLSLAAASKLDRQTIDKILNKEKSFGDNAACGITGIRILLAMARENNWTGELIAYDTSATASGDQSRVVGYAAMAFYEV